ncbi:DUF2806 domain-containing protein [Aliarcobacter butzleri]|uniref:DUF2806 domain-containing protein n=1 Tax=Aliarcobacter butzleri TaxID=28197 RepID=UPI003B20F707
MPTNNSLINLGELAKPINTLIEKISDATGVLYEPTRIRRKAKAEADAIKTNALVNLEIEEIQKRALNRLVNEEIKKQENIENITEKSFTSLEENATPENIENDWLSNFFDKCKLISDNEMQSLWAKILAGEANNPGTYSKRTIEFMATMDKIDAELFNKLAIFCWNFNSLQPIILSFEDKETSEILNYDQLLHLSDIGLISLETFGLAKIIKNTDQINISYCGRVITLKFPINTDNKLSIGHVSLTKTGKDIMNTINKDLFNIYIYNPIFSEKYYNYILNSFYKNNVIISEPLENKKCLMK